MRRGRGVGGCSGSASTQASQEVQRCHMAAVCLSVWRWATAAVGAGNITRHGLLAASGAESMAPPRYTNPYHKGFCRA